MANTIRIKRRGSGAAGAPVSLASAELAFNEVDNTLYYGKGDSSGTATSIAAVAGDGAFLSLAGTQTVSGNKTFNGTATFGSTVSLGSSASATTPASNSNDTTVATTAFVTTKTSGLGTGSVTSVALSLPNIFSVTGSPVTTSGTLTASLASQTANHVFIAPNGSAGAPTFRALVATDIPTLTASKISDFDTTVNARALSSFTIAPMADITLNGYKITNLGTPSASTDAATKGYVDSMKSGLDIKDSVRVATTANITLSGTQTIDGIAVVANDRVLVKNQTTGADNGIYICSAVSWSRSTDADSNTEVTPGMFVFVEEGSTNADSGWVLTNDGSITLGSTALSFTQFSGAGQITAGNGLTKTGNTLDIGTASATRIVVNADSIDLASGVATPGTYRSVTVDTYGRVTAGTAPTTLSGYGIVDAQPLDATLTALAGVTTAADQLIYATGSDTFATTSLTATARSVLDDTSTSAMRTTLGVAIGTDVQGYDATLAALAGVTTAADKLIYASGVDTFLTTDLTSTARTLLDDTSTGAMRTTLGVAIGTDVQAYSAALASIASQTTAADRMLYTTAANTYAVTTLSSFGRTLIDDADASTARSTLALGTIATQAANSVSITGGSISNLTTFDGVTIDGGTF